MTKAIKERDMVVHRRSGALGMKEGDRVLYTLTGQTGVAGEFMQDGDVGVDWDDGGRGTVKWNHLKKLPTTVVHQGCPAGECDGVYISEVNAVFVCEGNGFKGSTPAPVKSVSLNRDGTLTVEIDYWPIPLKG